MSPAPAGARACAPGRAAAGIAACPRAASSHSSPDPLEGLVMLGFLGAGVSVAYHVVTDLAHFLAPLGGGLAAVAAIIAFTVAIRLLLLPLSYYALRGQAGQARLQPELAELRRRHGHEPERLQREIGALYRRESGTLLIGCLPLLLQR